MASKKSLTLPTNSIIALAAVVAVVVIILTGFAGRVLVKKILLNSKVISKKQAAESQLKQNLTNLPQLQQHYQDLGPKLTVLNDSLPDNPDFPAIVAETEAIAGTSGVELDSVSPGGSGTSAQSSASSSTSTANSGPVASSATSEPQSYQFSASIKGSYANLIKFLQNMQLSSRPVTISGFSATGTNDALTGQISLTTYYFNPPILQDNTEVVK